MCGIIGIFSKRKDISISQIEKSLNSILHRGPDGRGTYLDPNKRVALGHVRLAIMDIEGGQQPMMNENQSLSLVANGEFYDFEKIRDGLMTKGHVFCSKSDSEIALHLFEEYGIKGLQKIRGEFAFILHDKKNSDLIAVRDRFGIKPLFYATYNDQILISSEIKALFAAGVKPEWDEASIYQSMHFAGLEGATLYKNVFQVPPGHYLKINQNHFKVIPYWDADYPKKSDLNSVDETIILSELKLKLEEAILLRTRSDVPMASYLSGGVDSSTVLGMANRLSHKKIPAFTIAFDHQDFDESQLAKIMCQFTGSDFHPIKVTNQDFADVFSLAIEKAEMPFYNGHAPARFILSREVKKAGYKVVLGGEGADELFAGYHFSQVALTSSSHETKGMLFFSIFNFLKKIARTPNLEIQKIKQISPTLYWIAKVLGFPSDLADSLIKRYENLQHFQNQDFLVRLKGIDPYKKFLSQFSLMDHYNRAPFHVVLYLWMKSHFPQYVLAAERLDMAHAVELRLPFLDHELFEITKMIPASLLYKEKLNKYLLRKIAVTDVCPEVLNKLKQPFVSPPSTLGNDNPLFKMICDLLSSQDFKSLPFFNHDHISRLIPKIRSLEDSERASYDPILYYLASLAVLKRKYKIT